MASPVPATAVPTAPPPTPPPTSASLTGTLGADGWYVSPVRVTLSASGPDPAPGAPTTLTTYDSLDDPTCGPANRATCQTYRAPVTVGEGRHILSYFSVDAAGRAEPPHHLSLKVDTVPPAVTCPSPTPHFTLNQPGATVAATVADGGAGPVSAVVSVAVSTTSVGAPSVAVTGQDRAGHTATVSCPYSIGYTVALRDNPAQATHGGGTDVIALQLADATGANVSAAAIVVHAVSVDNGLPVQAPGNAQPGDDFRYEAGDASYRFNLRTTGLASGAHTLTVTVTGDPTIHTVQFLIA